MALATKAHQDYKLVPIEEAQAVAWSFEGPHTQPTKYPLQFPELRPDEIRVKQTYFGLCYTDCHLVNEDWFPVNFPIVPGHEILGRVVAVGSDVVNHKIGDLVGLGFIRDNCGKCNICWTGNDNICQSVGGEKLIPIPKFGGFSTHVFIFEYRFSAIQTTYILGRAIQKVYFQMSINPLLNLSYLIHLYNKNNNQVSQFVQ